MRKALAPLLFALALLRGASAQEAVAAKGTVPAELLRKLADSDARIQELYTEAAFTLTTRIENREPGGTKVQSATEMVTRMFRKNGKPWEEIVRFVENGKDETQSHREKREKELERGKRNRTDAIPWQSPFGASTQDLYRFTDEGAAEDGTREVIHFETKTAAKERGSGDAIVDPAEGTLRKLHFTPSVLPRFAHKLDVEMSFEASTPAGPALSSFSVDAEGGLLFVKKHVHVEGSLEGYEEEPPMTASGGTATAAGH